jgi:ParB family chromosome partitioning protein
MAAVKKSKLGRGLDALLGIDSQASQGPVDFNDQLHSLAVDVIQPGRYQPRTGMDPERLNELADSIRAQGLIQPIIVRSIAKGRYEIIAGERRWRAAQLAGLNEVPCVVREVPDQATVAMALIENIQREDLNPLEEAAALKRLIEEFSLTHQQAAEAVGRSRAAVSNLLRLLELPTEIKQLVETKKLEMGHARALLTLSLQDAKRLALLAVEKSWSVRELEQHARQAHDQEQAKPKSEKIETAHKLSRADPNITELEQNLSEKLGAPVAIQQARGGKGKLIISYFSVDELEGILERIR